MILCQYVYYLFISYHSRRVWLRPMLDTFRSLLEGFGDVCWAEVYQDICDIKGFWAYENCLSAGKSTITRFYHNVITNNLTTL